jgi:hypothetical protein
MGVVKTEWMEAQERGWADIDDKHVCEECVDDEFLQQQIRLAVAVDTCDYCHRTERNAIAAPVCVVLDRVGETVNYYFSEPAMSGCPYDGGWLIEPTNTVEALLSLDLRCHDDLFADIEDAFTNDDWIPAADGHWSSLHPSEVFKYSWDRFCQWVQHETRFYFSQISYSPDDYEPQQIDGRNVLPEIGKLVASLGLISTLPKDSVFYRARNRTYGDNWAPGAESMGAPPSQQATAGRMNPAGISYLYLAFDELTAVGEVIGDISSEVAVAEFEAVRNVRVLDLTRLPDKPSIFDAERREQREGLIFLDHFVNAISMPVTKDGYEHVSYVSSQVVSEFFALVFKNADSSMLEGIEYRSSVCAGGKNLVLFPTRRGYKTEFSTVSFKCARARRYAVKRHVEEDTGK